MEVDGEERVGVAPVAGVDREDGMTVGDLSFVDSDDRSHLPVAQVETRDRGPELAYHLQLGLGVVHRVDLERVAFGLGEERDGHREDARRQDRNRPSAHR